MRVEQIIAKALKNIGIPCTKLVWNDEDNIPEQYVTWYEILRKTKQTADDVEILETYHIAVNIYSRYGKSYLDVLEKIEEQMERNGFIKSSYANEKFDKNTGYIHKPLSFKYYKHKERG